MMTKPVMLAAPQSLVQSIVNYMRRQPWEDVNALMVQISQLQPVKDEEAPPAPPNEAGK